MSFLSDAGGNGIEVMVEAAGQLRKATDGYLLLHSNAEVMTSDAAAKSPRVAQVIEQYHKCLELV